MKILVTGASGFLGGHVCELLIERGHDPRGMVRPTSRTGLLEKLGVEMAVADLKDPDALARAVEGVEAVVNTASTMSGPPQEYEAATMQGTRALMEAARTAGVGRFVHISSVSVYPLEKTAAEQPIAENEPFEERSLFLTSYVRSKIASDRIAREFAAGEEMGVIILRPGILYGPRGEWKLPRLGYALGRRRVLVVGRGKITLPVCYVKNCAAAALRGIEAEDVSDGVFNIVDDEAFTQLEYLRRLKRDVRPRLRIHRVPYWLMRALGACIGVGTRLLGRPSPIHPVVLKQCVTPTWYSNSRAKEILGWRPVAGKEEALAETMRDFARRESLSRRATLKALREPLSPEPALSSCIIGGGAIAQEHLRVLKTMPNAKPLAVCDLQLEAARQTAAQWGVPHAYADAAKMLREQSPDIVHVVTPPQSHLELSRMALEGGAHVLVEKPMALDAAEAHQMAGIARERGLKLCVDHNHLYDPTMVKARRFIESGAIGDVIWVESYYGFNLADNPTSRYMLPGGEKHWTFDIPGGLYQNLAPHPLCLALELLGEPDEVHTCARYGKVLPHAPTDELRVMLETPEACGMVTVSIAASPRMQWLNIYGTGGMLFVDLLNKWVVRQSTVRGVPKPVARALLNLRQAATVGLGTLGGMLKVACRKWTPYDGMQVLVREFYRAVQLDKEPPVTAREGVEVMEVMDRIWRSVGDEKLHR
ncbi:MAG: NAD-dependent epimerase/dehydratase family protein [Candidatus Brocadiia bacterium]